MTPHRQAELIRRIEQMLRNSARSVRGRSEKEIRAHFREHYGVIYVRPYSVGSQLRETKIKRMRRQSARSVNKWLRETEKRTVH